MLRGDLARRLDTELAHASLDALDETTTGADRRAMLDGAKERGERLIASLYAPHAVETATRLARFDEAQVGGLTLIEAEDIVAICCHLESSAETATAAQRYLGDCCVDLEAQRFAAWSRNDLPGAGDIQRALEVAEALTDGVRGAATRFALPVGRTGTVRAWISDRPDLYR
jgi:hypothetical protein